MNSPNSQPIIIKVANNSDQLISTSVLDCTHIYKDAPDYIKMDSVIKTIDYKEVLLRLINKELIIGRIDVSVEEGPGLYTFDEWDEFWRFLDAPKCSYAYKDIFGCCFLSKLNYRNLKKEPIIKSTACLNSFGLGLSGGYNAFNELIFDVNTCLNIEMPPKSCYDLFFYQKISELDQPQDLSEIK